MRKTIITVAAAGAFASATIIAITRQNPAYAVIWIPAGLVCGGVWLAARGTRLRTLVALGCAAVALLGLGLVAADASPAVPAAVTGTSICALTPAIVGPPQVQCINGDGHLKHDLHAVNFKRQGHQQTWGAAFTGCKIIGRKGCHPFPKGSGLNQQWNNAALVTYASKYHKGQCLGTHVETFYVTATPIQEPCKGGEDLEWAVRAIKGGLLVANVAYTNAIYNQCGVVDCHPVRAAAVLWIPGTADFSSQVVFWITASVGLRGHVCTHGITGMGSCTLYYK